MVVSIIKNVFSHQLTKHFTCELKQLRINWIYHKKETLCNHPTKLTYFSQLQDPTENNGLKSEPKAICLRLPISLNPWSSICQKLWMCSSFSKGFNRHLSRESKIWWVFKEWFPFTSSFECLDLISYISRKIILLNERLRKGRFRFHGDWNWKMLFRKSVPNVPGEHLAWNLFISRAMGYRPAISVKKDFITCVFPRRF